MESHIYNVNVAWSSDRKGLLCSPELINVSGDSSSCLEVATPPEFPKGIAGIWSPEHLYTAAISSCLMTTFLAVAENSKLDFISFSCSSVGKLEKVDGKFVMSEVLLRPLVVVKDESSQDRAIRVLEKAEANCLISNSVRSKISMEPMIIVEQTAPSITQVVQ